MRETSIHLDSAVIVAVICLIVSIFVWENEKKLAPNALIIL